MTDIKELPGISLKEANCLRAVNIPTTEQFWQEMSVFLRNGRGDDPLRSLSQARRVELLWESVSHDAERGFENTASAMGIPLNELVMYLAQESARESKPRAIRRIGVPVLTVMGIGLVAAALMIFRLYIPAELGWRVPTVIAARDLKAGNAVHQDDLVQIAYERRDDRFTSTKNLEGTRLAQEVRRGRPLHHRDILRLQVVAATDLRAGAIITHDAVRLDWSTYEPGAVLQLEEVMGHRALQGIQKGAVVLAGSFDQKKIADEAPGRQMLTITVGSNAFPPALAPPTTVNLLLAPREKGEKLASSLMVKDVRLLDIQKQGQSYLLVVGLTQEDTVSLMSRLSSSDVYVLPVP